MNYLRHYFHLNCFIAPRYYCIIKQKIISTAVNESKPKFRISKRVSSRIDKNKLPPRTKIDATTIELLERLSLVDCANRQGIETLEEAIAFADQILQVNTKGVDPLITVLEDIPLEVREDIAEETNRADILSNAAKTEEDYFVSPPGNIPLEAREDLLHEKNK